MAYSSVPSDSIILDAKMKLEEKILEKTIFVTLKERKCEMSYLYVSEQGASIGITANRFQVKYKDGLTRSIPIETLEVIEVFGNVQITTQCLTECLKRGVNVLFYSMNGAYYVRLISTSHVNVQRQRKQADIGKNEEFKLAFSKRIINANGARI